MKNLYQISERREIRLISSSDAVLQKHPEWILSGLRLVSETGLFMEEETERRINDLAPCLNDGQKALLRQDLVRILCGPSAPTALTRHHRIVAELIPEIEASVGFQQKNPAHIYDVWGHTAKTLWDAPNDEIVRLALLFHDLGKPFCYTEDNGCRHFPGHGAVSAEIAERSLKKLGFPADKTQRIVQLVKWHDRPMVPNGTTVREAVSELGSRQFLRLLSMRQADISAQSPECFPARTDALSNLRCIFGRLCRD